MEYQLKMDDFQLTPRIIHAMIQMNFSDLSCQNLSNNPMMSSSPLFIETLLKVNNLIGEDKRILKSVLLNLKDH